MQEEITAYRNVGGGLTLLGNVRDVCAALDRLNRRFKGKTVAQATASMRLLEAEKRQLAFCGTEEELADFLFSNEEKPF